MNNETNGKLITFASRQTNNPDWLHTHTYIFIYESTQYDDRMKTYETEDEIAQSPYKVYPVIFSYREGEKVENSIQ